MEKKIKLPYYVFFVLITVISIIYCAVIYWNNDRIIEINNCSWVSDETLKIHIDNYSDQKKIVTLSGWCLKEQEKTGYANYSIVVHGLGLDKYYKIKTGYERRDDVTENYADGYDYGNSGFFVNINKSNLPADEYEICLWYCVNNNNSFKSLELFFEVK